MDKKMSRREMLRLGSIAGASVIGGGMAGLTFSPTPAHAQTAVWPWPLTKKISGRLFKIRLTRQSHILLQQEIT